MDENKMRQQIKNIKNLKSIDSPISQSRRTVFYSDVIL